mgnify:CR=1 FL=1|jgi:hypothetical protein
MAWGIPAPRALINFPQVSLATGAGVTKVGFDTGSAFAYTIVVDKRRAAVEWFQV